VVDILNLSPALSKGEGAVLCSGLLKY